MKRNYKASSSDTCEYNTSVRLPKLYLCAARVLKGIRECKGTIGKLVTEAKHPRKQCLNALLREVIKFQAPLIEALEAAHIKEKNPAVSQEVGVVLAYELLLGHRKALTPGNRKVDTILKSEAKLRDAFNKALEKHNIHKETETFHCPRYVRLNTMNGKNVATLIEEIEKLGFKMFRLTAVQESDFERWKNAVKHLARHEFLMDFHAPDLLVFHPAAKLATTYLYDNYDIILHDKCSAMAARAMNPRPGSIVLDACAAPGIKATYMVSLMKQNGYIWAVDRDRKRCETLQCMLQSTGAGSCVQVLEKDFLEINPRSDESFTKAEYILVDPSCSGSGMVTRIDLDKVSADDLKFRLRSLHNLQVMLMKHAMLFPHVQRIVYSTCSVHAEENEEVVAELINLKDSSFKLVKALHEWPLRGLKEYSFADNCVRMTPEDTMTCGFFLAVFERVLTENNNIRNESKIGKKRELASSQDDAIVHKKIKGNINAEVICTSVAAEGKRKRKGQGSRSHVRW